MNKLVISAMVMAAAITCVAGGFTTLPMCKKAEGRAEIKIPNGGWERAEEGKYYPLGSSYRVGRDGKMTVAFAKDAFVNIENGSEFGTRAAALGDQTRALVVVDGTISVKVPENMQKGAFSIASPGFVVKDLAGESIVVYEQKGDGDEATVRCVTGSLGVEGRHFNIPSMKAANETIIRTSHDNLSTVLFGTSGDYIVNLDQGLLASKEVGEDGQITTKTEKTTKEWHLSPKTKIIINRSLPSIGERLSVHTMAFDAAGQLKSECSFCEGRAELNSGELVAKDKTESEEIAKRAAEAAETTETTEADDDTSDNNNNNNKDSDSKEAE